MIKRFSCVLAVILLACLLLSGCHGSRGLEAFAMPEEFDTSRDYEITFWAKNDTNKAQTDVYKKAIEDFEKLYPNIHVNLKLYTDYGRIYNDATVQQILQFHFAENRQNVGIYGITGAGKSYFLSACCVEACRRNYRCKFVDYCDLLDELIVLNRQEDLNKYRKRIKYYARIQLLFIDDFSISRYTEEGIKILYHLLKLRDDLGTSTLFSCQ